MHVGLPPRVRLNLRSKGLVNHQIAIQDLKFTKASKPLHSGGTVSKQNPATGTKFSFSSSIPRYQKAQTLEEALERDSRSKSRTKNDHSIRIPSINPVRRPTLNRTDSFKSRDGRVSKLAHTGASTFYTKRPQGNTTDEFKETSTTLQIKAKTPFYSKWMNKKPSIQEGRASSREVGGKTSSTSMKRSRLNMSISSKKSLRNEKSVKAVAMAKKIFTPEEMRRLGYFSNVKTRSQFVKNCHGKLIMTPS